MKSQTRKRAAHCRRESVKTGGGQAPVMELNSLEEMVVSLIPNCQLEGCEGGLESEECVTLSEGIAATPLLDATIADTQIEALHMSSPESVKDAMIALETVMAIPAALGAPVEKPKAHKQTPASTMSGRLFE
ncbi:uncharacterized protein LOC124279534 isoform X2 [Haliotis rubra]|uniref:uncharacterized protein LOC124279534 isoform X2 n=1 Tax=Haliotis rubra TaxID=36100 RepID=UPI001EE4F498|nr:uncharacterized protein LOC124279534 isoform X2 [Haliotis rubra]